MHTRFQLALSAALLLPVLGGSPAITYAEESTKRQIEEVIVTAQRRESTVSDTSIAISAMDQGFLENMGVQGPDDLVEFVPATTRTEWDIKIRGVGRNFRHLGGDPGVATFYNGIYSTDFGIASTEGALFDIARVEVLRGPQGTLYGRNAIGGALNYITNSPTFEWEAQLGATIGEFNTREVKGILSGPITDSLAFRLNFVKKTFDETMDGIPGSADFDDDNDENQALMLLWNPTDDITVNMRVNNRNDKRNGNFGNSAPVMIEEGPWGYRKSRDDSYFAYGLRSIDQTEADRLSALNADVFRFVHPGTGETILGARARPGVDASPWPYGPNPLYNDPNALLYDGGDADNPNRISARAGYDHQAFDQRAVTLDASWQISDSMEVKYLYGYQNFDYIFDRDNDFSADSFTDYSDTDRESVYSWSHELQLFWEAADSKITGTSGIYMFYEDRMQWYAIRNRGYHGYINNAPNLGQLVGASWLTPCTSTDQVVLPYGSGDTYGFHCGDTGIPHKRDNDTGAAYEGKNMVENTAFAAYTQIDWELSDDWMVTLGIRWAEDKRLGVERRFLYFEDGGTWMLDAASAQLVADTIAASPGMTSRGAINILMGNADPSGDPNNPITPKCEFDASTCATPLRLGGIPMAQRRHLRVRDSWDDVTWRVNFNWTPNDNTLVYFGATTGVRGGGWALGEGSTAIGNELQSFDSEQLLAYELGYKAEWLNNTMQVNMALYFYDYENYQDVSEIIDPTRDTNVTIATNVPNIVNKGFEIDGLWLATDNLTIGGNYGYTISEYDGSYILTNYNDPRYPRDIFGSDIRDSLYSQDVNGKQLQGIPKHKGVIWGAYKFPTRMGDVTLHAMYAITGEFTYHEFSRPFDIVPKRERMDVRATWQSIDESWEVSAFVDNVMDETSLRNISQGGPGNNFRVSGDALFPRFMGVEATYRWNP